MGNANNLFLEPGRKDKVSTENGSIKMNIPSKTEMREQVYYRHTYTKLKVSPYIIHSADYIFLLVFEISAVVLRNQKFMNGLESFTKQHLIVLASFGIYYY